MIMKGRREPDKAGPLNVALYARVSSDKQANKEDGSLDTQLDRLNSFVEYKRTQGQEWIITERLVEGEKDGKRHGRTGKDMDRAAVQKVRELAKAQLIDVVVITKIDRISRSVIDFLLLVEELDRYGVKVVSLRENIDLTTPSGKFQTILLIALAQHEREVIAVRTKEKVEWRAEKGFPLGPPPIGYVMKDKMYAIDEQYAEHVRAADALYLEHNSVDALIREFRKRGYRTPGGSNYTKPMLFRMLHNPTYAAKIEYEGQRYEAQWKPLRSWDTHQTIQRILSRNRRHRHNANRQSSEYVYLLQGLLRCGICGRKMSPKPAYGRNGVYYPYYLCGTAEKSTGLSCNLRHVPAEALDQAALSFMERLHLKPERVEAFAKGASALTSETIGKLTDDLQRVRLQLANVRMKLTHLADVIADGGKAAMATLKGKLEALESERQELESSETRLVAELEAEQSQQILAQDQIQTLSRFQDLVQKNRETPDRIKSLIPRFVDYVVWRGDENGRGQIEVALFPNPVDLAPDVEAGGGSLSSTDNCGPDGRGFVREVLMGYPTGFEPATAWATTRRSNQLSYGYRVAGRL